MSLPYSPIPAPLPDTITLPQDVIDDVIVETINPPFQDLANAAKLAIDIAGSYGRSKIKNQNVAQGDIASLEAPAFSSGEVHMGVDGGVAFDGPGVYLVALSMFVSRATATLLGVDVVLDMPASFPVVLSARATPNAADAGWLVVTGLVEVPEDIEGSMLLIMYTEDAFDEPYVIADDGQLSVHRIR